MRQIGEAAIVSGDAGQLVDKVEEEKQRQEAQGDEGHRSNRPRGRSGVGSVIIAVALGARRHAPEAQADQLCVIA